MEAGIRLRLIEFDGRNFSGTDIQEKHTARLLKRTLTIKSAVSGNPV